MAAQIPMYQCFMCSQRLQNLEFAIEHVRTCEHVKNEGHYKCMIDHSLEKLLCKSVFGSIKALKRHMRDRKCIFFSDHLNESREDIPESNIETKFNELIITEDFPNNNLTADKCEKLSVFIESFVEKLNSFNLQQDVFNEIIHISKDLLLKTTEINQQFARNLPREDVQFLLSSTRDFAATQLDKFASHYKRKAHLEKNPFFIAPLPLQIGSDLTQNQKPLYYVPILQTLNRIFANNSYKKMYFDYNNNHRCVDNIYDRYCCGENYNIKIVNFFKQTKTRFKFSYSSMTSK